MCDFISIGAACKLLRGVNPTSIEVGITAGKIRVMGPDSDRMICVDDLVGWLDNRLPAARPLSEDDATLALGCSLRTLRAMVRSGQLPTQTDPGFSDAVMTLAALWGAARRDWPDEIQFGLSVKALRTVGSLSLTPLDNGCWSISIAALADGGPYSVIAHGPTQFAAVKNLYRRLSDRPVVVPEEGENG